MVVTALTAGVSQCAAAAAAGSSSPIAGGSWFFQPQIAAISTPAGPVAPPAALPTPDVPAGDYAVAGILGQPNKETYLHVGDLVPSGSTVESLTLTLKEASGAGLNAAAAKIDAHPVTGFFSDGGIAQVWGTRPSFDPSVTVHGIRGPDGTWTFDLKPIAARWASGDLANNGIALVPAPLVFPDSWEVVWAGEAPKPSTTGVIVASGSSGAGGSASPEPASPGAPASAPEATAAAPGAVDLGTSLPLPAAAAAGTTGATSEASAVTGPTTSKGVRAEPIATEGHVRRGAPWPFFLAGAVFVLVLVAGGVALTDRGEPPEQRRGGVLRALERHGGASAMTEGET